MCSFQDHGEIMIKALLLQQSRCKIFIQKTWFLLKSNSWLLQQLHSSPPPCIQHFLVYCSKFFCTSVEVLCRHVRVASLRWHQILLACSVSH